MAAARYQVLRVGCFGCHPIYATNGRRRAWAVAIVAAWRSRLVRDDYCVVDRATGRSVLFAGDKHGGAVAWRQAEPRSPKARVRVLGQGQIPAATAARLARRVDRTVRAPWAPPVDHLLRAALRRGLPIRIAIAPPAVAY